MQYNLQWEWRPRIAAMNVSQKVIGSLLTYILDKKEDWSNLDPAAGIHAGTAWEKE